MCKCKVRFSDVDMDGFCSMYLFHICDEGLTSALTRGDEVWGLRHILFGDDFRSSAQLITE